MGLNNYEKKLIKVLEDNQNINTRRFIKLAGLGKATFYQSCKNLEASGYISTKIHKNQRLWYLVPRDKRHGFGIPDSEESILEQRYQTIDSKVMSSLAKMRKGNISDKIDVYGDAIVLILAYLGSMKLVSIYRKKRVPKSYARFVKRLELLLEKISDSKFFSDYGFGRTAIDMVSFEAESRLDEFLGIKQEKKISIY